MHLSTSLRIAAAVCLLAPGAAVAQDEPVTADTVVASVNGTDITLGHMIVLRDRLPDQYQSLPDDVLYQAILDQIVQQTVIGQLADDLTRESELVLDNERRALLAAQVVAEIAEGAVTDEALGMAYDLAYGNAEPEEEFNASHILVETEEAAAALVEELAGGADFAALAQEHSTGPTGPNGGNLGWFSKGMMVPEFEAAVLALEVGTVSDPVQTQFGWHVVRLNDKRQKEAPSLEEVREELAASIRRNAVEDRLEELTDAAEITRAGPEEVSPSALREVTLTE